MKGVIWEGLEEGCGWHSKGGGGCDHAVGVGHFTLERGRCSAGGILFVQVRNCKLA